ncbi:hypothetical protein HCN44_005938 [Aphidius gifuensis]|uniref:Uncharacterized protein n=1 Tax=Aphidius gifuensis TaxID=684658 RepID=A0A834XX09_APHGI|nr:hypothetical protein HCN44_005938 [Aphidius gifuensis]
MSKNDIQKDDEDYWNSSEKHAFSFDQNNEVENVFGISKSGTAQLRAGISNIEVSNTYFKHDTGSLNVKPLLSIINEPTLIAILNADKIYLSDEKPTTDPVITLRRILLGQPFTLEYYKSLGNKTALLDAAIASALVQRLLMDKPGAIDVYTHYLATRLLTNDITDLLTMQGRSLDAAMTNFNIIVKNTKDEVRLLQKLSKCFKTQFMNLQNCRETQFVHNYIKLLEWKTAYDSSVLDCLRYSCKEHWSSSDDSIVSPFYLLHQHEITPRQYQKIALQSRISAQAWGDIDILLLSKGWLGSQKLQTNLPIEDVLKILHNGQAPSAVLDKFLKYVDNTDRRLQLARALSCSKVIIEVTSCLINSFYVAYYLIYVLKILASQGDRASLLEYKDTLVPNSESYFLAEKTLSSSTIRWKS